MFLFAMSIHNVMKMVLSFTFHSFLEAKASKGMHQLCIEKSPDRCAEKNSSIGCTCIHRGFCKML